MRSRYRTLLWPLLAALLPLLAVWLAPPRVRAAGTWYVSANTGDDANDCAAPATPCLTIQAALGKPGFLPGDTVLVAEGWYVDYTNFEVVLLNVDATLSGGWDDTFSSQDKETVISGNRSLSVAPGISATVTSIGMLGSYYGGLHNQGDLILRGTIVLASNASGLYNAGTMWIYDSDLSGSYRNGVINGGTMTITNTTIAYNDASGIYNTGTLTMYNSIIRDNTLGRWCNGLWNQNGTVTLVKSAIVQNGGNYGGPGGGFCNLGDATLIDSTVSDNHTRWPGSGGGINTNGNLLLYNTTVSHNSAQSLGGGIVSSGNVILQNSLLAENTASSGRDCYSTTGIQSLGYNLIGDISECAITSGPGDLLDMMAAVFPPMVSTGYAPPLGRSSPAIDAGDPTGCKDGNGNPLSTDQRGVSRVGRCDIGSYEYDPQLDPLLYFRMPWVENR